MIYYILTLALGALCWAMWSYTAYREIKTLRSDLVASQVALGKATRENKAKATLNTTMLSKIKGKDYNFEECVRINSEAMRYVRENAYFNDIDAASLFFVRWADTIELLKGK